MKVTEQLSDLRARTADDLAQRAREIDDQVFRLRIQKSMGQSESGNKMRPLRRELARIQTVLKEKGGKEGVSTPGLARASERERACGRRGI